MDLSVNQMTHKKVEPERKYQDNFATKNIRYAQGLGAAIRQANELHAVRQTGRLPFLQSSNLHEDVLKGNLSAGTGFKDMFGEQEDYGNGPSRLGML